METPQASPAATFTVSIFLSQYDVRRRNRIATLEAAKKIAREAVEASLYVYDARSSWVTIDDGTVRTGRTVVGYRKAAGATEIEEIAGAGL